MAGFNTNPLLPFCSNMAELMCMAVSAGRNQTVFLSIKHVWKLHKWNYEHFPVARWLLIYKIKSLKFHPISNLTLTFSLEVESNHLNPTHPKGHRIEVGRVNPHTSRVRPHEVTLGMSAAGSRKFITGQATVIFLVKKSIESLTLTSNAPLQLSFNSLAPRRIEWNFRKLIFRLNLLIDGSCISCEISLRWMSLDLTDDQSTLVQVMAWGRQATSHYLSSCWPRSVSPNGVTRPL